MRRPRDNKHVQAAGNVVGKAEDIKHRAAHRIVFR